MNIKKIIMSDSEDEDIIVKKIHYYPEYLNKDQKYECKTCNFVCEFASRFTLHLETNKHQRLQTAKKPGIKDVVNVTQKVKYATVYDDYKVNKLFLCRNCNFRTSEADTFHYHMQSSNHILIDDYVNEAILKAMDEIKRIRDEQLKRTIETFERLEIERRLEYGEENTDSSDYDRSTDKDYGDKGWSLDYGCD